MIEQAVSLRSLLRACRPSTVSFTKMRFGTGGPGRLRVKLPGAASTVAGSYAPTANLVLDISQKWASVLSACANSNVPFLTVVQANPAAISQGTW